MSNEPQNHYPVWLRITLIIIIAISALHETYIYSNHENPGTKELWIFAPTFIMFLIHFSLVIISSISEIIKFIPNYEITTWVSLICFFISFFLFYRAIYETDGARQSIISGFAGSVLGFATGIPVGLMRGKKDD